MQSIKVGLNGFGRIGRAFTRIASDHPSIEIAAINTAHTKPESHAYLLQYDSVYRKFDKEVTNDAESISIEGNKIAVYTQPDPSKITWGAHDISVVIDCTGAFKTREDLSKHLRDSVQKVIVTAPTDDTSIPHVALGVNDHQVSGREDIISNASCTTNCAAIIFDIIHKNFGIKSGFLTTNHSYTSSQELLDDASKTFTRSRAAGLSLIPTTTGAASAISKVTGISHDQIQALAIRIPTPVGSLCDISIITDKQTTVEEIHAVFKREAKGRLKGLLAYETVPLVSSDYIGSPYSCVYDANYTAVLPNNLIKILGWYDNEWGYSSRLVDLIEKIKDSA